jgi:hypothetical protein
MKTITCALTGALFAMLLFQERIAAQITYTWNTVGVADWTVPGNWIPSRVTLAANDILVFDNGGVNTPINIPVETIGQLVVSNNTTVNLQANTGAVLTVWGSAGDDLVITAGSSLNCNGNNAITLFIAAGATASINGSMNFSVAAHKLNAADNNAIQFNGTAIFVQDTGCSGNVFTVAGAANAVVFNSGTTFIQKAGANPFGLPQPAAKVIFKSGSLYKHQQLLFPSFTGRTYAGFEIDFAGFNQSALGVNLLTIEELIITQGTLSLNLTGGIHITGNITVAAGQALHFNAAAANTISFNGTVAQHITSLGTLTFNVNESINFNNASGITINSDLVFNNNVNFLSGIVTVPGPQSVTLGATASVSGMSDNSFVNGMVKKAGNTPFLFPVGKSTGTFKAYVPIAISAPALITDEYAAEYKRASAAAINNSYTAGLDHVSGVDHWILNRTAGVSAVDITLYWTNQSSNNGSGLYINDLTKLTAAHYNGSTQWESFGGNYIAGSGFAAGSIKWMNVNAFSALPNIFSLGSTDALLNPLPIVLNYFSGAEQHRINYLNWKINCSGGITIKLLRSDDRQNFKVINTIKTDAIGCLQPFVCKDQVPLNGNNYYQLKIYGDGTDTIYSNTVVIANKTMDIELIHLLPIPVYDDAVLNLTVLRKKIITVVITGADGMQVQKNMYTLFPGSNQLPVHLNILAEGVYQLTVYSTGEKIKTIRFIKH